MVASSMNKSPGTRRKASSCDHSPRLSTSSTPHTDSNAPSTCRRVTLASKNSAPTASIHTGMLEPTSVTLMGVEVCSAMYCSAL